MLTVSLSEFLVFVHQRNLARPKPHTALRPQPEKVLRGDQLWRAEARHNERRLATCPVCDALVDSDIIHPKSGLCPICHAEQSSRF